MTAASLKDREESLVRSGFKRSAGAVVDGRRGSAGSHRSHTATGMCRVDTPLTAYSHWLERGNMRLKAAPVNVAVAPFDIRARQTMQVREKSKRLLATLQGAQNEEEE